MADASAGGECQWHVSASRCDRRGEISAAHRDSNRADSGSLECACTVPLAFSLQ
jgi:hypothetical protein